MSLQPLRLLLFRMKPMNELASAKVVILGLGLMGGSLAMALRGRCALLLGVDPDEETRRLALRENVVERVSADPAELFPAADIVILAAPVRAILSLLDDLPAWHPGIAIVLDLGSTKREIVERMDRLPGRFDPLGGHPMCGKERGSLINADARLFQDSSFALSSLPRTTMQAKNMAEQIVQAVGAHSLWIDAEIHDRWVAATSHLPYLISNTLAFSTHDEASPLVGPGFRSTARLAPSPAQMMIDILLTNRGNVLQALREFQQDLAEIARLLENQDEVAMRIRFAAGAERYERLVKQEKMA